MKSKQKSKPHTYTEHLCLVPLHSFVNQPEQLNRLAVKSFRKDGQKRKQDNCLISLGVLVDFEILHFCYCAYPRCSHCCVMSNAHLFSHFIRVLLLPKATRRHYVKEIFRLVDISTPVSKTMASK